MELLKFSPGKFIVEFILRNKKGDRLGGIKEKISNKCN